MKTVSEAAAWLQLQGWSAHPETLRQSIREERKRPGSGLVASGGGRGRPAKITRKDLESFWQRKQAGSRQTQKPGSWSAQIRGEFLFRAEQTLVTERLAGIRLPALSQAYRGAAAEVDQLGHALNWPWKLSPGLQELREALTAVTERPTLPYKVAQVHQLRLGGVPWDEVSRLLGITPRHGQRLEREWREKFGAFSKSEIDYRAAQMARARDEWLADEGRAYNVRGADPSERIKPG